jgi:CelD/BcsL family acetyltransferase involved in cellulose biosynthesis
MTTKTAEQMVSVAQNTDNVDYTIYSDLAEIRGLSQQWEDLLATAQYNQAFASLEWYLASCRIDNTGTPYVIAGTRGAEMTCLLALLLNRTAGLAMFPEYGSDYNDVLVRGSNPQRVADLLRYAISAAAPCRHLKLSKLRPDSHCVKALPWIKCESHVEWRHSIIDHHYYAKLPPSFDDYLASLGMKFRKNIRRGLRAIAATRGLAICELYPSTLCPAELPDIYFRLFMCRHGNKPLVEQMKHQSFVREVLPAMFQKGRIRVFGMLEEERVIAVMLFFVAAHGLLAWNGGFLLAGREQWSPGTSLYAFAIRQAIAEGLHEIDFGDGDEAYKQHWTNLEYGISEVDLIFRC